MKKTDLYRHQATLPEQATMNAMRAVGGPGAVGGIATLISLCIGVSIHGLARTTTGDVADISDMVATCAALSMLTPAMLLYVVRGTVKAPNHLLDAVEQAEDDATDAVPDDIRAQVFALRPAAQSAARQLNAAEEAEKEFRARHHRAYAKAYGFSGELLNPELYDAIAPEREELAKVKADADTRIRLICQEADTLARTCRRYTAAVGTPNYDFLVKARKAASAAPSIDALRERTRVAEYELEVSSALDGVPTASLA